MRTLAPLLFSSLLLLSSCTSPPIATTTSIAAHWVADWPASAAATASLHPASPVPDPSALADQLAHTDGLPRAADFHKGGAATIHLTGSAHHLTGRWTARGPTIEFRERPRAHGNPGPAQRSLRFAQPDPRTLRLDTSDGVVILKPA